MDQARDAQVWGWAAFFGLAYFALAEAGCWLTEPAQGRSFATVWPASGLYAAGWYFARRHSLYFVLAALAADLCDVLLAHNRELSAKACREANRIVHIRCSLRDVSGRKSAG